MTMLPSNIKSFSDQKGVKCYFPKIPLMLQIPAQQKKPSMIPINSGR